MYKKLALLMSFLFTLVLTNPLSAYYTKEEYVKTIPVLENNLSKAVSNYDDKCNHGLGKAYKKINKCFSNMCEKTQNYINDSKTSIYNLNTILSTVTVEDNALMTKVNDFYITADSTIIDTQNVSAKIDYKQCTNNAYTTGDFGNPSSSNNTYITGDFGPISDNTSSSNTLNTTSNTDIHDFNTIDDTASKIETTNISGGDASSSKAWYKPTTWFNSESEQKVIDNKNDKEDIISLKSDLANIDNLKVQDSGDQVINSSNYDSDGYRPANESERKAEKLRIINEINKKDKDINSRTSAIQQNTQALSEYKAKVSTAEANAGSALDKRNEINSTNESIDALETRINQANSITSVMVTSDEKNALKVLKSKKAKLENSLTSEDKKALQKVDSANNNLNTAQGLVDDGKVLKTNSEKSSDILKREQKTIVASLPKKTNNTPVSNVSKTSSTSGTTTNPLKTTTQGNTSISSSNKKFTDIQDSAATIKAKNDLIGLNSNREINQKKVDEANLIVQDNAETNIKREQDQLKKLQDQLKKRQVLNSNKTSAKSTYDKCSNQNRRGSNCTKLKEELTKANSALSGSTLESEEELNGKISKIQNNITKINKDSVSEQKKNQEELDNDIIKAQNNILKNENKDNITAVVGNIRDFINNQEDADKAVIKANSGSLAFVKEAKTELNNKKTNYDNLLKSDTECTSSGCIEAKTKYEKQKDLVATSQKVAEGNMTSTGIINMVTTAGINANNICDSSPTSVRCQTATNELIKKMATKNELNKTGGITDKINAANNLKNDNIIKLNNGFNEKKTAVDKAKRKYDNALKKDPKCTSAACKDTKSALTKSNKDLNKATKGMENLAINKQIEVNRKIKQQNKKIKDKEDAYKKELIGDKECKKLACQNAKTELESTKTSASVLIKNAQKDASETKDASNQAILDNPNSPYKDKNTAAKALASSACSKGRTDACKAAIAKAGEMKAAYLKTPEARKDITTSVFEIHVNGISPGMKVHSDNIEENVNFALGTIIQKLMIGLGSLSVLIMTIGAGYIVLHNGQDELLNKGKSIFMSGIYAMAIALSSYYLITIVRYILYH